jgi:signal transduction histidine kinase
MQQPNLRLVTDNAASSVDATPALHAPVQNGSAHTVQFYESEQFLYGVVGDFLAEGLVAGQPLVVIATEEHREAFAARLRSRGFDIEFLARAGRLTMLDAKETLATFMVNSVPDQPRFLRSVGSLIERVRRENGNATVRAFGEMVDVLWREGNTKGAIQLEKLWNDLATKHVFSLLCAYAMGNFIKSADTQGFQQVCSEHSHVVPTERYVQADDASRAVEISVLQQRAQALESEIAHREELEQRLRSALAEAEAANMAKSEFLAVMSHELRTPLNAIGGHVQLIEMGIHGPVTDPQRDALLRVIRSQRHLLVLINDILNLARIETGRVEYAIVEFPVVPLLSDVCAMLGPIVRESELTCEVRQDESVRRSLMVRGDREKVRQIVLNLLTNAIKFTPSGGAIVLEAGFKEGVAEVRVSDTGIGIEADKLDSIFEPFVQLGSRDGARQEGVGLGLAISRDLARGMGGDLMASSEVGSGTTFTLVLPVV